MNCYMCKYFPTSRKTRPLITASNNKFYSLCYTTAVHIQQVSAIQA